MEQSVRFDRALHIFESTIRQMSDLRLQSNISSGEKWWSDLQAAENGARMTQAAKQGDILC